MTKVVLQTFVREQGKTIKGDTIDIGDGRLQAVFDRLQKIDWNGEFGTGFREHKIQQFVIRGEVDGIKVVVGLTPASK